MGVFWESCYIYVPVFEDWCEVCRQIYLQQGLWKTVMYDLAIKPPYDPEQGYMILGEVYEHIIDVGVLSFSAVIHESLVWVIRFQAITAR